MEILISVGILGIVVPLLAQVLFTTTRVNKKNEILTNVKQDGTFALDVVSRMVRTAKSIEVPCAQGDLTATSADITDSFNNVTTLACFSDGNAARIASISGTTGEKVYLSAGNVTLSPLGDADCSNSTLAFSCPAEGSIQTRVTITFTLGQVGLSGSTFETTSALFQSTISMRN